MANLKVGLGTVGLILHSSGSTTFSIIDSPLMMDDPEPQSLSLECVVAMVTWGLFATHERKNNNNTPSSVRFYTADQTVQQIHLLDCWFGIRTPFFFIHFIVWYGIVLYGIEW